MIRHYLKAQAFDYYQLLNRDGFMTSNEVAALESFLGIAKNFLPEKTSIFKALELCGLNQAKVVILGQDPYPNRSDAMGLAFSVKEGVYPPASLRNVLKCLHLDTGRMRTNGNLEDWAKQGVLLLNTSLTVEEGKPESHRFIWSAFITELIWQLDSYAPNLIWALWGNQAKKFKPLIRSKKALIIESSHPSPLSAHKGFLDHKPFTQINKRLSELNFPLIKF